MQDKTQIFDLTVCNMGRQTRQYSICISMAFLTFYMVNSTFYIVNLNFYVANSTFLWST